MPSSAFSESIAPVLLPPNPPRRAWWPNWTGETVLIAASGPSQRKEDLDFARGKCRVVAVNRTWELCPWADVLYSGDPRFWCSYDTAAFKGLKVAGCKSTGGDGHTVPDDFGGVFDDVKAWLPECCRLHLSGTQAIIYAAWWGAARILLTGFDMMPGHWHEGHNSPPKMRWEPEISGLSELAKELSAEIINCTRVTALRCFPLADLKEAI